MPTNRSPAVVFAWAGSPARRMAPGSTSERLEVVMTQLEAYLAEQQEVLFYNVVRGAGGDQGSGQGFIRLQDWKERPAPEQGAGALADGPASAAAQPARAPVAGLISRHEPPRQGQRRLQSPACLIASSSRWRRRTVQRGEKCIASSSTR